MVHCLNHAELNDWLAGVPCTLHARISQYDQAAYNRLIHQSELPLAVNPVALAVLGSTWDVTAVASVPQNTRDTLDLKITFRCSGGSVASAAASVELEFPDWSESNYVLLPSAAYNGNRFPSRRIPYSPKLCFSPDIGPDRPPIITDVPRLDDAGGPSRIQERSGSLATPAIGFQAPQTGRGFWLFTHQGNALGDYGIDIEETRDRRKAVVSVRSPVVREMYTYRICDLRWPSDDRPRDFSAGDEVSISLRLLRFDAPGRQALFDRFASARKEFIGGRPAGNTLSYSACFELLEQKFNRENFVPEHGYYSVGLRENFLQDWQIGWTGGMISTYPLLFAGSAATRANVIRNFDWLFPAGISPSGFFWDACSGGTQWIGGDIRKPHTGNWHLIRKSADAVFYLLKQFRLMEDLGLSVKSTWSEGTRTVCDAFVRLWDSHKQFGQFVDSLTGEVRVGGSASAALAPAALVLAADYFGDARYRWVALEAANAYHEQFTRHGLSCGGPGDACQNPDSESWYSLVESYVALFEATGDRTWLDRAGAAARQFSTWVVSYDFAFPPKSTFGAAGIRTTGAVYANTQNKHAAPGICTMSGLALLKLFRATGDRQYLGLLHDIAHNLPQYLPHPLKPLGDAIPGHMCERVNMTDWEGVERIGETLRMTTWAETSLMLTCTEIPGLYVQPERGLAVAFDNVEVAVETDTSAELRLRVTNPTPTAASVRILAESLARAAQPLGDNALRGARKESFRAGESRTLVFPKRG